MIAIITATIITTIIITNIIIFSIPVIITEVNYKCYTFKNHLREELRKKKNKVLHVLK